MTSAKPNPRTEPDQRPGLPASRVLSAARRSAGKPRGPFARAFTLAEVLIAIAILGVCISLGATLFPLAIRTHEESVGNTIGMLIAENALTVAKTVLTDGEAGTNVQLVDSSMVTGLSPYAFYYPAVTTSPPITPPNPTAEWVWVTGLPAPRPATLRGAVVLARRIAAGRNDYQLIAVACEKEKPENSLGVQPTALDISGSSGEIATIRGAGAWLKPGGAIVLRGVPDPLEAGKYAVIDTASTDGKTCKLKTGFTVNVNVRAFVVVEKDRNNTVIGGIPVMAVMSTRTGLRPS